MADMLHLRYNGVPQEFPYCCCIHVQGSVAYVPQQAWVQSATLKENILFGKRLDNMKYGRTIEVCGLAADIDLLPERDATMIGDQVSEITKKIY